MLVKGGAAGRRTFSIMEKALAHAPVHNADIARAFEEIADLLELRDENPFRVRAYRNAARVVGELSFDASARLAEGAALPKLPGIGERLLARAAARCKERGIRCEQALYVAMADRASGVVLKEARRWRADLVVMGTHGRRGVRRLALGSDAEQVARNARVPVLLVRVPGR